MPVIGHAFAGWATAELAAAADDTPATRSRLLPALVIAAYLPDIAAEAGRAIGFETAQLWSHSLVAAAAASPVLAWLSRRLLGIGFRRAVFLAAVSVGLHDVIDIFQSADRLPFFPLSSYSMASGQWLPEGLLPEAAIFAPIALLTAAWRRHASPAGPSRVTRPGLLLLIAAAASAAGMNRFRAAREATADAALFAIASGEYRQALAMLESADRWPAPAKPGRIDYLRAEAYIGLKDRPIAEGFYLASLRKDPTYMFALADLVKLYVSGDDPLEVRRGRAEPYLAQLRRFDEPYARKIVALAESRLGRQR